MPTTIQSDVVIIGAGVAGCVAALALSPHYHVTLIDKRETPVNRIGECLPPAARRILRSLQLLHHLETPDGTPAGPHLPSMGMQSYWGGDQLHVTDHLRNPDGFGWHLDRRAFEVCLREAVVKTGVVCLWPAKLVRSRWEEPYWKIEAASPDGTHEVQAKFVIDAAGRPSPFAKQQGRTRERYDKLVSCWATAPNTSQTHMGLVCSVENGWWYSAPLPNGRRVIAFQTDSDLIHPNMHKDPDLFLQQARTVQPMGAYLNQGAEDMILHGVTAASSTRLTRATGRQWAALGDAAISLDPLSSQGMFNAMATAMQLTQLMVETEGLHPLERDKHLQEYYNQQTQNIWDYYQQHKFLFYSQEQRWPLSEFWKRRHNTSQ